MVNQAVRSRAEALLPLSVIRGISGAPGERLVEELSKTLRGKQDLNTLFGVIPAFSAAICVIAGCEEGTVSEEAARALKTTTQGAHAFMAWPVYLVSPVLYKKIMVQELRFMREQGAPPEDYDEVTRFLPPFPVKVLTKTHGRVRRELKIIVDSAKRDATRPAKGRRRRSLLPL